MKNKKKIFGIVLVTVIVFTAATCFGQSGGRTINSAEDLKKYLDSQPANSPDKPIRVSMTINDPMLKNVVNVIRSTDKYVSLNITGNLLTTLPEDAFENCKMLAGVIIPDSVTNIGSAAFRGCTSLTSVTIGSGVTSIEIGTFSRCTGLTSVTIGNSVTTIYNVAFAECTSLTSITIPNSVTSIMGDAFIKCTSLTSVTIGNSVTSIGGAAFYDCTRLTRVTFAGTIPSSGFAGDAFYQLGDLREKYLAGGIGTYTTTAPVGSSSVWTKQ